MLHNKYATLCNIFNKFQVKHKIRNLIFVKTRNMFCRTRSLSNATFFLNFWSRDVHPVQNLLLCTKFHDNRMIFIARQDTDARYWYSNSVRLSVRPSICLSVCLSVRPWRSGITWKRLNISSQFFSPYGSPIILVLSLKHLHEITTGSPTAGALNTGGV